MPKNVQQQLLSAMTLCRIVIPARYGASRLPGKPLLSIAGKPMIVHVCERALEAGCGDVFVATDDERIAEAVRDLAVTAVITRKEHESGTERIAELVERCGWGDREIVVNLQGDEPLIDPSLITKLAQSLKARAAVGMATLAVPLQTCREAFDPNVVKVVMDAEGYALYFSRAPIPWSRDDFGDVEVKRLPEGFQWRRHLGIYAYTVEFLKAYVAGSVSPLEQVERLEQLRVLWRGGKILVIDTDAVPVAGVDTAADLERVRATFSGH